VVREDSQSSHLRGGAVAAFALVRAAGGYDLLARAAAAAAGGGGGGGGLGALLAPEVVGPAALYAGQCVLVFAFAAAAVEAAFGRGLVKRMRGSSLGGGQ
jgi:hypothetical protein